MADQTYPEPTVGIFIFNPEEKLLLLRSHKWPGGYTVPGGHVELGESLDQAARREAREETGLEVFDLRFLCWQEFIYDPSFWKSRHFIFFDYACKSHASEVLLNDEAQTFEWIDPRQALELDLDQYTRVSILEYLKQRDERENRHG